MVSQRYSWRCAADLRWIDGGVMTAGVYLQKTSGRWIAVMWHEGKDAYIGIYDTRQEARDAYLKARALHKAPPSLPGEVWSPMEESDVHLISSHGRVWSYVVTRIKNVKPRLGRLKVSLVGRKSYWVSRLVAKYFIPNPENKPHVNHIDNNPSNNHVSNLEWVTHRENMRHAANQGRMSHYGEANPYSKLTEKEVSEIRRLYEGGGMRQKDIGNMFGVSQRMVSLIARRENWPHV